MTLEKRLDRIHRVSLWEYLFVAFVLAGVGFGVIRAAVLGELRTDGFKTEYYEGHKYVIRLNGRTDIPVHAPDCPCRKENPNADQ